MQEKGKQGGGLHEGEKRFLAGISRKYAEREDAGLVRSYLIAAAALAALFAVSRWLPWWWAGLIIAEAVGLVGFHQYKRFSRFRTRILLKLWRERSSTPA